MIGETLVRDKGMGVLSRVEGRDSELKRVGGRNISVGVRGIPRRSWS